MTGLSGRSVLVTRAADQAEELCALLRGEGAVAVAIPVMRMRTLLEPAGLDRIRERVGMYDLLVFTSANAVRLLDASPPRSAVPLAFAIGPGTAAALLELGWHPQPLPARFVAESLAEALGERRLRGRRVLLPRAQGAREVLPQRLQRAGAEVEVVEMYRMEPEPASRTPLRERLAQGDLDWVTFTSSSSVECFVQLLGSPDLPAGCRVACIGPVTAESSRRQGLEPVVIATRHDLRGLVDAMAQAPLPEN